MSDFMSSVVSLLALGVSAPHAASEEVIGSNPGQHELGAPTISVEVEQQNERTARVEPLHIPAFLERPGTEETKEWKPPSMTVVFSGMPTAAVVPDKPNEKPATVLPMTIPMKVEKQP